MTRFRDQHVRFLRKHPAMAELIAYAEANGCKVKFSQFPNGDWSYGYFSGDQISVYTREPSGQWRSIGDIAFILAHEVCHLQQLLQGKYKSYYSNEPGPKPFLPGIRAERHCDSFAKNWCVKHNLNGKLLTRKYPSWRVDPRCLSGRTLAHRQYMDIIASFKRLQNARRAKRRLWKTIGAST